MSLLLLRVHVLNEKTCFRMADISEIVMNYIPANKDMTLCVFNGYDIHIWRAHNVISERIYK